MTPDDDAPNAARAVALLAQRFHAGPGGAGALLLAWARVLVELADVRDPPPFELFQRDLYELGSPRLYEAWLLVLAWIRAEHRHAALERRAARRRVYVRPAVVRSRAAR